MRTLLDTCVISEINQSAGDPRVKDAVLELGWENAFVSVISLGEVHKGVSMLPAGKRRMGLEQWLRSLVGYYGNHILDIDLDTSFVWGELAARPQFRGRHALSIDLLIASTAIVHGMQVMTRNTKDFDATGVTIVNPWLEE